MVSNYHVSCKKIYSSKFYDDLIVLINLWRYPNIIMVDGLGIYLVSKQ